MNLLEEHPELAEVDTFVAVMIIQAERVQPLTDVEHTAVDAIVALSHAGAELMTEASHAGPRDVERLSKRARTQLDRARELMADLLTETGRTMKIVPLQRAEVPG